MIDKGKVLATGLFNHLNEKQIEKLLSSIEQVTAAKETIIIQEGEKADACFILIDGVCQVYTHNDAGDEIILARLEIGAYFGEQALLNEVPGKRNAYVRAVSDVTLYKINHETFLETVVIDKHLLKELEKAETAHKRAEEKLKESEEIYCKVIENIYDIVYSSYADGTLYFVSPNVQSITGYKPEEIIGKKVRFDICMDVCSPRPLP